MIWAIGGLLAALTALACVFPLFRQRKSALGRNESALEIFKDQLGEVDRDAARGLISGEEAQAARSEIKRRMLALSRSADTNAPSAESATGGGAVVIAAAVLIPVIGFGLYAIRGEPDTRSLPFAERAAEQEEANEITRLAQTLRNRLMEDPQGGPTDGWVLLGQTYMRMGRVSEAAEAFGQVADRPDADSVVQSRFAEALIARDNGVVTPRAATAIARAMELDPLNPAASFYQAQYLAQEGRLREAHAMLLERVRREGSFQPWMEIFVNQANSLAEEFGGAQVSMADLAPTQQPPGPVAGGIPGPTAEDMEAAQEMTEEDRGAFIQSMVTRLAERLEEEPGDLDGWLRLARAYAVLGETENARAAADKARTLIGVLPEGDPTRDAAAQALDALGF